MLSPGRYLKPITGGDTEGTGKATVIEIMRFGEELWYRHGGDSVLYDLAKHQLDEKTLVREQSPTLDIDSVMKPVDEYGRHRETAQAAFGTQGHQAEDDLLFPERLELISHIRDIEAGLIAYEVVRGNDELLAPLKRHAAELVKLSKSYLEVPKP